MLYAEFNMEDAIAVAKEEGIAIGQENKEREKKEALKEFKDKIFALLDSDTLAKVKLELGRKP